MTGFLRVGRDRLWAALMELKDIGGYDDEATGGAFDGTLGVLGGIRHTPSEYSNPTACGNGTDLLANAILRLAQQP